jgi:hypothetical protein
MVQNKYLLAEGCRGVAVGNLVSGKERVVLHDGNGQGMVEVGDGLSDQGKSGVGGSAVEGEVKLGGFSAGSEGMGNGRQRATEGERKGVRSQHQSGLEKQITVVLVDGHETLPGHNINLATSGAVVNVARELVVVQKIIEDEALVRNGKGMDAVVLGVAEELVIVEEVGSLENGVVDKGMDHQPLEREGSPEDNPQLTVEKMETGNSDVSGLLAGVLKRKSFKWLVRAMIFGLHFGAICAKHNSRGSVEETVPGQDEAKMFAVI